ncbi:MAG: shikimate dehydrogenase [Azospirillaceae bacterium]
MSAPAFRLAGVMGWPIGHSRSPALYGHWLARYGIHGAYVPLAVAPDRLAQAVEGLRALGFAGANVTVPHKEAVLALADEADPLASRIGAANTLLRRQDGSLHAMNTDAYGFLANLEESASFQATGRTVAVLGAGGAARAVIVALVDAGAVRIRLANRTRGRAESLADAFGPMVEVVDWRERSAMLDGVDLLVNTTALGLEGQPPLEIDLAPLPEATLVTDIVYAPLETPLLAAARRQGNPVVDGLGMLLHQAVPGFEAWFGVRPTVDAALRAAVLGPPAGR